MIKTRLKEGFTIEDFKTVHRKMFKAWGGDSKMCQYLRPETLYSNKFEGYLNKLETNNLLSDEGMKAANTLNEWVKEESGV